MVGSCASFSTSHTGLVPSPLHWPRYPLYNTLIHTKKSLGPQVSFFHLPYRCRTRFCPVRYPEIVVVGEGESVCESSTGADVSPCLVFNLTYSEDKQASPTKQTSQANRDVTFVSVSALLLFFMLVAGILSNVCIYVSLWLCMYAYMYVTIHGCIHVNMYVNVFTHA